MMRVVMPKWHEDARRMRQSGMGLGRIAVALAEAGIKVSESRISQVTNANWQRYMERDQLSKIKRNKQGGVNDKVEEMTDRVFDKVTSPDPTDKFHRVRVRCSHDDCSESLTFARRGPINPTQAAHWFRDKGWGVGGGPRADLCPEHFKGIGHKEEEAKPNGSLSQPIQPEKMPPVADASAALQHLDRQEQAITEAIMALAEPLPAPTKTEKRIIYSKLNDLYLDEFVGYRDDWNDDRVAKDLGVPVEWVATIRNEDFGPNINQTYSAQLAAFEAKVEAFNQMGLDLHYAIEEYDKKVEEIDAKIDAFEALCGELKALLINKEKKA